MQLRLVLCAVIGTAALAACSSDTGDEGTGPDDPPSTPEASETSDVAEAPPPLPDDARGTDDAAAIAFVEHWVDLMNYAFSTGDTQPARESASECDTCHVMLDGLEGPIEGQWVVSNVEAFAPSQNDAALTDTVVVIDVDSGAEDSSVTFGLTPASDSWRVAWLDVRN